MIGRSPSPKVDDYLVGVPDQAMRVKTSTVVTVSASDLASVPGSEDVSDLTRSLASSLIDHDELRGRVRLAAARPQPGQLGAFADTLEVALGAGGAATVLASAMVSWVRQHRSDLRLTVRRGDGEQVELTVRRLRGLDAAGLPTLVNALGRWLDRNIVDGSSPGSSLDRLDLDLATGGTIQTTGGDEERDIEAL